MELSLRVESLEMEIEKEMEQRIERWKEREETTPLVWAAKMAKCIVSHGLGLPNAELRQYLLSIALKVFTKWVLFPPRFPPLMSSPYSLAEKSLLSLKASPKMNVLNLESFLTSTLNYRHIGSRLSFSADMHYHLTLPFLMFSPDCGTWPSSCPLFFFFIIIIALIDYTLDDWGLRMTSLDI
ncbi:hypothetical protein SCA6_009757 [Theobroma cacao]